MLSSAIFFFWCMLLYCMAVCCCIVWLYVVVCRILSLLYCMLCLSMSDVVLYYIAVSYCILASVVLYVELIWLISGVKLQDLMSLWYDEFIYVGFYASISFLSWCSFFFVDMDTSWIDLPPGNPTFYNGCMEFLELAKDTQIEGKTRCPCNKCKLSKWLPRCRRAYLIPRIL